LVFSSQTHRQQRVAPASNNLDGTTNPFNPSTTVWLELPRTDAVTLAK
jgi:hypothetical protein